MNSELVAVQALLELQGDRRYCPQTKCEQWTQPITNEVEDQTTISKLFNSLITSKTFKCQWPNTSTPKKDSPYPKNNLTRPQAKKETCEIGTQTDFDCRWPDIETMERVIKELHDKIQKLELQLKHKTSETLSMVDSMDSASENTQDKIYARKTYKRKRSATTSHDESVNLETSALRRYNGFSAKCRVSKADSSFTKPNYRKTCDEMVTLGDGNLRVPIKLWKQMDWSSHTNATRKLLSAVFPRHVLATHSLTGKRSPAFPGKPAKKQLDAALVSDIVQVVVEKCNVPENIVRTSITTKCADESKMYRTRQMKKKKRKTIKKENMSPSDSDSDF